MPPAAFKERQIHFSLLTQFTLLSLIVTAAIAIALAYVLRQKVIENMLEQVATIAGEQADRIIAPYLTAPDFAGLSPDRLAALPYIRRILARNEALILSPNSPDLKANECVVLSLDNVKNLCPIRTQ